MATPKPDTEPEFVRELAEEYKCTICTNLLDTPVLTECCGQHFCRDCLEKWFTSKKTTICPHCRAEHFNKIVSQPIIRKIKELQVYCTNRKNGCKKILSYGSFQEHVDICAFGFVECTNACNIARLLRKDRKQHCQEECSNRIVNCRLCNEKGKHYEIVGQHTKQCPEVSLECPNKCGENVKRKDIEQHREQCPLEIVECPFKEAGCEVSLPRKDLPNHEIKATQNHLRLTMSSIATVRKENNTLKQSHDRRQQSHNKLQQSHDEIKQSHDRLQQSHDELKQSHDELKQSHDKLQQSHDELKLKLNTVSSAVSTELNSLKSQSISQHPIDSIQTTLTSLTTMIQPDGKSHTVHIRSELGICRELEEKSFSSITTASSPMLWIHPGFKLYLCVINNALWVEMMESDTYGYPDKLFMQVNGRIYHTPNLRDCSKKGNKIRVLPLSPMPSDDFYVTVQFNRFCLHCLF